MEGVIEVFGVGGKGIKSVENLVVCSNLCGGVMEREFGQKGFEYGLGISILFAIASTNTNAHWILMDFICSCRIVM